MCGICGIAVNAETPNPALLRAMNATLAHRGPDGSGEVINGPVGLAMRRLAIIDLPSGDQPITNEDQSIFVVQNGEIYNHRELRRDLEQQGHRFSSDHSDTEVLVHLYEQHGPRFVQELRGMFALAIWDSRKRQLLLARDRFGIKPLFYTQTSAGLLFASELKALLAAGPTKQELCPQALTAYLAFNSIPAPYSIFSDIKKLPPGHTLLWDAERNGLRLHLFARPTPNPRGQTRREPARTLAAELQATLRDSVQAHLESDVPVGVLLSGGVDSAALTALASGTGSTQLKTFSIGFAEASFNELERARLVAARYETDHHELVVEPDAAQLLTKLVSVFDEPFADSSAIPTYLVCQLAAKHVKVVLSGEGADELFGGYYTYAADMIAPYLAPFAGLLAPLTRCLPSSSSKASFDYKAKRFVDGVQLPPLERHHAWKEIFSPAMRAELLTQQHQTAFDPVDLYRARFAETAGAEMLARLQDVDLGIYLVDDLLVKTDRASMAHSLEARVPFLDQAVADFAHGLATKHKVRGLAKKRLLREAVAPLLPKQIVHGKKHGFSIPVAAWLRGPLSEFACDTLAPTTLQRHGLFNSDYVERLLADHQERKQDHSRQLWGLLAFTLWYEQMGTGPA